VTGPEPVFSSAAMLGTILAVLTWTTKAPSPTAFPGFRRLRRALVSAPVTAGFWLVMLPAVFSGVIWVLAPLRLDELGASGLVVGAVFLVSALAEGAASPSFGRLSDRRGRLWPIRIGLVAAAAMSLILPLPDAIFWLGAAVVAAELTLGFCWTPAMALLSDTAERTGIGQWFAFALVNLAWSGGQVLGGSGGGGLADATSDAVPFACVAALMALTAVAVAYASRRPAAAAGAVSQ
jgi:MFS family permease